MNSDRVWYAPIMEAETTGNRSSSGYYTENGGLPTVGSNSTGNSSYCSSENERPTANTNRNGYLNNGNDSKYKEYNGNSNRWDENAGQIEQQQLHQSLISGNHAYNFDRGTHHSHGGTAAQQPNTILNAFQHSRNPLHFNGISNSYSRIYNENPSHLPNSYPAQSIATPAQNLPHYPYYHHRPSRFIQLNDQIVAYSQQEQQQQQEGSFYFLII